LDVPPATALTLRSTGLSAAGTLGFATAGRGTFDAFWESVAAPFEVHRRVLEAIERYGRRRD
jgi:hypothetical protein